MFQIRRRQHYNWRLHTYRLSEYRKLLVAAIIIYFFVLVFCVIVNAMLSDEHDTAMKARLHLVQSFDAKGVTPNERQQLASALLLLHDKNLRDISDTGDSDQQKQVLTAVRHVAETGEPLRLDTTPFSWQPFLSRILPILGGALVVTLYLGIFITYAFVTVREREYLMDLEWRHVWPIAFVLFTIVPGLPFYMVSAVRVAVARSQPETADTRRNREPIRFNSDIEAARQRYVTLRQEGPRRQIESLLIKVRSQVADTTESLRQYGEIVRSMQTQRNRLAAEITRLESIDVEPKVLDQRLIAAEFDRLIKLPGVAGIRVINGTISLLLEARLSSRGVLYDFGDWELRFGADSILKTKELRTGVRVGRDDVSYVPVYRLGDGEFCFGGRSKTIEDNLAKGQILEAIELAVATIQSVNDEHEALIPLAFYTVED